MLSFLRKAESQFKAGKLLYENGYFNDSLSRLYYALRSIAVFLIGMPPKGKWKHSALMKKLVIKLDTQKILPLSREERQLIKRFPNERERADYEPVEVSKEKVEKYIQLVERILKGVEHHVERDNKN
jgi:uncharacterized protein (UPF0332 family)